jgi:ribosomal protein S18 acetylase RimI-like enzyme
MVSVDIRPLAAEESRDVKERLAPPLFEDTHNFRFRDALAPEELARYRELSARMGDLYRLELGAFVDGELAGWSFGEQESGETYYMINSAVLPAFRRRGLYRALVEATVREVAAQGFQRIYSRHVATNNAVIIPKLQVGFVITALELSDRFGTLVHLTYFPHPLRRKVTDYRAGQLRPDAELRAHLPGLRQ